MERLKIALIGIRELETLESLVTAPRSLRRWRSATSGCRRPAAAACLRRGSGCGRASVRRRWTPWSPEAAAGGASASLRDRDRRRIGRGFFSSWISASFCLSSFSSSAWRCSSRCSRCSTRLGCGRVRGLAPAPPGQQRSASAAATPRITPLHGAAGRRLAVRVSPSRLHRAQRLLLQADRSRREQVVIELASPRT